MWQRSWVVRSAALVAAFIALWPTVAPAETAGPEARFRQFPIPTRASQPRSIVVGPDGNVWFTEQAGNRIGRLGRDGRITELPLPTPFATPSDITVGPDGAL